MEKNMELLCRMWKFSAMEYMQFLKRYDIECFALGVAFGENLAIYADEEKYLQFSIQDNKFNENEKQLINLLELLEEIIEQSAMLEEGDLENYDEDELDEEYIFDEHDDELDDFV